MKNIIVVMTLTVILSGLSLSMAFAHGGGLDANGGHTNRRTGEYHYHRGGPTRAPSRAAPLMQSQPSQKQQGTSVADEIKKLYELHKQGILSKEEYEQGKRKLLR